MGEIQSTSKEKRQMVVWDEIINWIKTNKFDKWGTCQCDFAGDWLGNGNCVGCGHPIDFFKNGWCTYPVVKKMSTQETIDTIIKYIENVRNSFE